MKIKVVVFDLDDTLYNEIEYVKSGFKEVSNYFSNKFKLDKNLIYDYMIQDLEKNGRGKIFDNMLENFKIYSKENIKKAIFIYRTHKPNIVLPQESIEVLRYYNSLNIPLYIVTDGILLAPREKMIEWSYFHGRNPYRFILDKRTAVDIDDGLDLACARAWLDMDESVSQIDPYCIDAIK